MPERKTKKTHYTRTYTIGKERIVKGQLFLLVVNVTIS